MRKKLPVLAFAVIATISIGGSCLSAQTTVHIGEWPYREHDCSAPIPHVHDAGHEGACDNMVGDAIYGVSTQVVCSDISPNHNYNLVCGPSSGPNMSDGCTFTISTRCGYPPAYGQGAISVGTSGGAYPHCFVDRYRGTHGIPNTGGIYICQHPSGGGQQCECDLDGHWSCASY